MKKLIEKTARIIEIALIFGVVGIYFSFFLWDIVRVKMAFNEWNYICSVIGCSNHNKQNIFQGGVKSERRKH